MLNPKQVIIYKKTNGEMPFTKWLNGLDKSLKGLVLQKIDKVVNGNISDCSILKNADGIREARIRTASGIRIYYTEEGNEIIILLAGGDKDTQDNDIKKAKEYLNNYKELREK